MSNFKAAREFAKMSQKEVALTLKVSAPTVSDWESGKMYPSAANLKALSKMYNVTVDYLLSDDPDFIFIDSNSYIRTKNPVSALISMYNINPGVISKITRCTLETAKEWDCGLSAPNCEQIELLADYFELNVEDLKKGKIPLFPHIKVFSKIIKEIAPRMPGTLSKEAESIAVRFDNLDDFDKKYLLQTFDYINAKSSASGSPSYDLDIDVSIDTYVDSLPNLQEDIREVHQR